MMEIRKDKRSIENFYYAVDLGINGDDEACGV